jgi:hypothetical protein
MANNKPPGYYTRITDDNLREEVRTLHKGQTIYQFQKTNKAKARYNSCLRRGILDDLVEEGTLIRKCQPSQFYTRMSIDELTDYVTANFSGESISGLKARSSGCLAQCRRKGLIDKLVGDGVLIRGKAMNGTWVDHNTVLKAAQHFLKEHPEFEELPGAYIFKKFGYRSLAAAIDRFGGFPRFRREINLARGLDFQEGKEEPLLECFLAEYIGGKNE